MDEDLPSGPYLRVILGGAGRTEERTSERISAGLGRFAELQLEEIIERYRVVMPREAQAELRLLAEALRELADPRERTHVSWEGEQARRAA